MRSAASGDLLNNEARSAERGRALQPQFAQSRVIVRATALGPVKQTLALGDGQIVDAGVARLHQSVLVEFPVLVAVGAKPVAAVVVPLIGKAYRNTVIAPRPQFLNQPVLLLFTPFPLQEVDNLRSAVNKFAAVTPFALDGIGTESDRKSVV